MVRALLAVLALLVGVAPAGAQPRRVAVMDFVNTTKDPAVDWLGAAAAEDVTTRLHAVRAIQLVERAQLYKVIQEQKFSLSDLVDPTKAVALGKLLDAEQVVLGTYAVFGGTVRFNARFVDVTTGAILATSQVAGVVDSKNPDALWTTFERLAKATIDSLNTRVAIVQGSLQVVPAQADQRIEPTPEERAGLAKATAKSLEAQQAFGLGQIAYLRNHWAQAVREFERATTLDPDYAVAWGSLGTVLRLLGHWPQAATAIDRAHRLYVLSGDERGQAATLNELGMVHWRQGRYREALAFYERSLRLRQKLGDEHGQAANLSNIGTAHGDQGRYGEALAHYERSLALAQKLGNEPGQAAILNNIGFVHWRQGRYGEALARYEWSLRLKEELGDEPGQTIALTNIGAVYADEGRYAEALAYHERSLRLGEKLGDEPGRAAILNNIGAVHERQGRQGEALTYYESSLRLREKLGDQPGQAVTLNNIGTVRWRLGHKVEALQYVERALAIAERLGMAGADQIRRNRDDMLKQAR